MTSDLYNQSFIKPPLAIAALPVGAVHLFVGLFVCR